MKFTVSRNYSEIIDLPHHVSKKHPQMSLSDRAAQFSPFAALVGYDDTIDETARITDAKSELDDDRKTMLDMKYRILKDNIKFYPEISVEYFIPDEHKAGGKYITFTEKLIKTAEHERLLIFEDGTKIPLDDIYDINSELFKGYDLSF